MEFLLPSKSADNMVIIAALQVMDVIKILSGGYPLRVKVKYVNCIILILSQRSDSMLLLEGVQFKDSIHILADIYLPRILGESGTWITIFLSYYGT